MMTMIMIIKKKKKKRKNNTNSSIAILRRIMIKKINKQTLKQLIAKRLNE